MSSPTPTSSSTPAPHPPNLDLIIGVSLGIPGLLLIFFIVWYTLKLKQGRTTKDEDYIEDSHGWVLDGHHPAARITPFGNSRLDMPRFGHTPGRDMRIAIRRPDGGWQFSTPRSSRIPAPGLDNTTSPSAYAFTSHGNALGSPNPSTPKPGSIGPQLSQAWQRFFTKEQEGKVASERRVEEQTAAANGGTGVNGAGYGYSEYDVETGVEVPPPAYRGHDR